MPLDFRTVEDLVCPKNAGVFGDPIVPYKFTPSQNTKHKNTKKVAI